MQNGSALALDLQSIAIKNLRNGQEFSVIRLVYTYATTSVLGDKTANFVRKYSIYEACPFEDSDPILLIDKDGIIASGKKTYTVESMDYKSIDEYYTSSSPQEKMAIKSIVKGWGFTSLKNDVEVKKVLMGRAFIPRYRLFNPDFLSGDQGKKMWSALIDNLLSYNNVEKDSNLRQIFKTHLLRGYSQRYNSHAIVATNPATGKTEFYDKCGIRFDKITANSLIGFSKGSKEVYYGAIHNQIYTLTIEQIESQVASAFLGFMLSFMEKGESNLHVGGVDMKIKGDCPIVLTANPTGYDADKIASFKSLIDHLTTNHLALGRRFGIIVYGNDYKTVDQTAYLDEEEWVLYFELFRAVEEFAWPKISKIWRNKEVLKWLNRPIPNYNEKVKSITEKIYDSSVQDFIKTHASAGFRHTRGAAFSCAILDSMPNIVQMDEDDLDMLVKPILAKADENLDLIVGINLQSFANMATLLESMPEIKNYLMTTLPNYLKDLIAAVDAYKSKNGMKETKIPLKALETYMSGKYYTYVAEIEVILKGSNKWKFHNANLSKYFGFTISGQEDNFSVDLINT